MKYFPSILALIESQMRKPDLVDMLLKISWIIIDTKQANKLKQLINRSIRIAIAAVYLAGGFMFFQANFRDHLSVKHLQKEGVEAKALVKKVTMTKDGICPYLEYEYDGAMVGFYGHENPDLEPGNEVMIKYDPDNLQEAALLSDLNEYPKNFKDSVFGSALFCGICFGVSWFTLTSRKFRLQLA